jgi:hypothetical protein
MDTSEKLADYYESLIERVNADPSGRPLHLPKHDRIIYYIISTRCEMDMNGFDSVFDQLLSEEELAFLIEALKELDASRLAELFELAQSRLESAGFFAEESLMVLDLEGEGDKGLLDDIEEAIRDNDALWELDNRLVQLIPMGTT